MRKLRLEPERLAIESFAVAGLSISRGTVAAREWGATPACPVTQSDCQTNIVFCPSRVVTQCNCVTDTC
ncbi:MAG TPA: hypothetical protein VFJ16_06810 [Longimicrobium sp.]|nr:hypothetical protein [Longimicrobium sp.]